MSSKLIDCEGEIADSVVFYAVEEPLVKVTRIIQGESKTRLAEVVAVSVTRTIVMVTVYRSPRKECFHSNPRS